MSATTTAYDPPKAFSPIWSFVIAILVLGAIFCFGGHFFPSEENKERTKEEMLQEITLDEKEEKKDETEKEKVKEPIEPVETDLNELKELLTEAPANNDAPALALNNLSDMAAMLNGVTGEGSGSGGAFGAGGVFGGTGIAGGGGGDLFGSSQLDEKPSIQSRTDPKFPKEIKSRLKGASFDVSIQVNKDGNVQRVEVQKSSLPDGNNFILDAVRQWRFKPGMRQGKAVPFKMRQVFNFA